METETHIANSPDAARAFFDAIQQRDTGRVHALLQVDPSLANARSATDGTSAVRAALYCGNREAARAISEAGAVLDLFDAAATGDVARLDRLAAEAPDSVSGWSGDGFQATHLAAFFGHPVALAILIERHGAEPDLYARHPFGVTPLHAAVACGDALKSQVMARLLIFRGADVNARQGTPGTQPGEVGGTPLMAAAQNGDPVLTALLLQAGADRTLRNGDGKTALDIAQEQGAGSSEEVIDLLSV